MNKLTKELKKGIYEFNENKIQDLLDQGEKLTFNSILAFLMSCVEERYGGRKKYEKTSFTDISLRQVEFALSRFKDIFIKNFNANQKLKKKQIDLLASFISLYDPHSIKKILEKFNSNLNIKNKLTQELILNKTEILGYKLNNCNGLVKIKKRLKNYSFPLFFSVINIALDDPKIAINFLKINEIEYQLRDSKGNNLVDIIQNKINKLSARTEQPERQNLTTLLVFCEKQMKNPNHRFQEKIDDMLTKDITEDHILFLEKCFKHGKTLNPELFEKIFKHLNELKYTSFISGNFISEKLNYFLCEYYDFREVSEQNLPTIKNTIMDHYSPNSLIQEKLLIKLKENSRLKCQIMLFLIELDCANAIVIKEFFKIKKCNELFDIGFNRFKKVKIEEAKRPAYFGILNLFNINKYTIYQKNNGLSAIKNFLKDNDIDFLAVDENNKNIIQNIDDIIDKEDFIINNSFYDKQANFFIEIKNFCEQQILNIETTSEFNL